MRPACIATETAAGHFEADGLACNAARSDRELHIEREGTIARDLGRLTSTPGPGDEAVERGTPKRDRPVELTIRGAGRQLAAQNEARTAGQVAGEFADVVAVSSALLHIELEAADHVAVERRLIEQQERAQAIGARQGIAEP